MSRTVSDKLTTPLCQLLSARPEMDFAHLHGSFLVHRRDPDAELRYRNVDVAAHLATTVAKPFDYQMALSVELTRAQGRWIDVQVLNHTSQCCPMHKRTWATLGPSCMLLPVTTISLVFDEYLRGSLCRMCGGTNGAP